MEYNMTTQIIERERVKYSDEFLLILQNLGIEIPNQCLYKKQEEDDE